MSAGLVPGILSRCRQIPLVVHVQDLQLDAARELGLLRQPLLLAGLSRFETWLWRRAKVVSTISGSMAARLAAKGVPEARLRVLPNWADLENIRPGTIHNLIRRELGLTSEIVALYAGNLGEKQGLEVVLQAAALTRKRRDLRYLMAGEGAARERLERLAEKLGLDNLLFLPLQSNERFPLLLAAADLHLVVQRAQAADLVMPSKLANIMAARRPFIATAGAATELGRVTAESQAGLLTPPEDAEAHWNREGLLRQWEELLLSLTGRMGNN